MVTMTMAFSRACRLRGDVDPDWAAATGRLLESLDIAFDTRLLLVYLTESKGGVVSGEYSQRLDLWLAFIQFITEWGYRRTWKVRDHTTFAAMAAALETLRD